MSNNEIKSAITQLKSFSKEHLGAPEQSVDSDAFAPEVCTAKMLRELSCTVAELSAQMQAIGEAAEERHKEAMRASKLDWFNLVCAAIAALGVLIPACVYLISHLCSNV